MHTLLDSDDSLRAIHADIDAGLANVRARFDAQLASELPPVRELCDHVRRYRGKMLRPTLVLLCGMACAPSREGEQGAGEVTQDHITAAAVCEMIHMATLVHDDVLDESDVRRGGPTLNRLRGNEASVILGDYLIAASYHLCSQIADQSVSLLVAKVSMTLCEGELLQLHHRDDYSLDEPTYFEIIERKTASLISLSCRLGARLSGAEVNVCDRLAAFGSRLGVAFQIQDDLLDLTGDQASVGKSIQKDIAKGKLTLPVIHHLEQAVPIERGRSLRTIERAASGGDEAEAAAGELLIRLRSTRSLEYARGIAEQLVGDAKDMLGGLPPSAAHRALLAAAEAVVNRSR